MSRLALAGLVAVAGWLLLRPGEAAAGDPAAGDPTSSPRRKPVVGPAGAAALDPWDLLYGSCPPGYSHKNTPDCHAVYQAPPAVELNYPTFESSWEAFVDPNADSRAESEHEASGNGERMTASH